MNTINLNRIDRDAIEIADQIVEHVEELEHDFAASRLDAYLAGLQTGLYLVCPPTKMNGVKSHCDTLRAAVVQALLRREQARCKAVIESRPETAGDAP